MNTFFFKIKQKTTGDLSSLTAINPHKHWKILLGISLGVSSCLIVFSFYLLFKIKKDEIFQVIPATVGTPSLIKEKLLKNTLDFFEQKLIKENEIKNNPPSYKDPSI